MKGSGLLLFVFAFLLACSCGQSGANRSARDTSTISNNKASSEDPAFRSFLKKFKTTDLPLKLTLFDIDEKKATKLSIEEGRRLGYEENYLDPIYAYGMLPDTADSYKLIWLSPAEIYIPILTTVSRTGKLISKEYLGIGACGSDCCYTCNEYTLIKNDMSIFSVDSIKACECDSNGPKENTMKKYILYKEGKILPGGKIQMSAQKRKDI